MVNNASVREHYKSMVPDQVSHKLFWKRYFFKVHLIELQEARRNILKKRAEEATKEADSGEALCFWEPIEVITVSEANNWLLDTTCIVSSSKI